MSRVIWKYPLEVTDQQTISVPNGFTVLCVQMQAGAPCLWISVDPKEPKAQVDVRVVGTGHEYTPTAATAYIGTVQDGPLVWHVFMF